MTQNQTLARAFSFIKRPYWPAKRLGSGLIQKGLNGMYSASSNRGMKRVYIQENWPKSWKYSYTYDLEEVCVNSPTGDTLMHTITVENRCFVC